MQWSENIRAGDSPLEIRLCARAGVRHLGIILLSGLDAANICFQFLEASLHSHDARFPLRWITSPKHCRGYFPPRVVKLFCFYCVTGFGRQRIRAASCFLLTYFFFFVCFYCTYLVVELPRHVIFRCASVLKNGPEVNFDKLPLRTMTEMAENSAQTSQGKLGHKHLGCGKKGKETLSRRGKKKKNPVKDARHHRDFSDTSPTNRKPLVNLTSLSGCPLQVPRARHPHTVGKRWSYICPSFCLHQNSAWGREERSDHGETSHK